MSNEQNIITTETAEPTVGKAGLPLWPVLLLAVLFFGSQIYVDGTSGAFRGDVYAESLKLPPPRGNLPPEVKLYMRGEEVYSKNCSACHQQNGLGTPGQFPPLAGSEWVLSPSPNRTIRILLDAVGGPIKVKGVDINSDAMLAWRDQLKEDDIAAVVTFIRGNTDWGNAASFVKPEQVKAVKADTSKHAGTKYTAAELLQVPEK